MALDAVPKDIDYDEIKHFLTNYEEVKAVHDLHIWAMSTTENALSVHLVTQDTPSDKLLTDLKHSLHEKFGIEHTTIQLENTELDDALNAS